MDLKSGSSSLSFLLLVFLVIVWIPSQALNIPWSFNPIQPNYLLRRLGKEEDRNEIQRRQPSDQIPVKIRKMSSEESEMFWPEYWGFDVTNDDRLDFKLKEKSQQSRLSKQLVDHEGLRDWINGTMLPPLQAAFALHALEHPNQHSLLASLKPRRDISPLSARAFTCPGDTTACTSINRPNSCCSTGSVCQIIPDTGQGDVGCCGGGDTCTGQVASCPDGQTSCPGNVGGGCCVAGYACSSIGCVASSTVITTIQPVVTASPLSSRPSSTTGDSLPVPPPGSSSSPSDNPVTSISTFTAVTSVISTATASPSHTSSTSSPSSSTASRASPTSSASAVLPVRPTSSAIPTITTTAPPTTITASECPTGFYQCSAYEHAGCCRVGRDCGLTSCPAASGTLAINSNGVTVNVVPSGSGDAALGANGCATGWFSCAAGQGGGCCPSGYACGTSCTATAVVVQGGQTGTATVAKNNRADKVEMTGLMMVGSVMMVLLRL